jgi:tetratricopeptide (TPR) repeat protein
MMVALAFKQEPGDNRYFREPMSKFVICNLLFVILLLPLGCKKKPEVKPPAPEETATVDPVPPAVTPDIPDSSKTTLPDPAPPANTSATFNSFNLGEADFYAGKYQQAALSFESFLDANPQSERRDQALFLMALSRALADGSYRSQRQSEDALRQLISEFPESPYRKQAEYILALKTQIERLRSDIRKRDEAVKELSEELNRLKQIDMQRRPSRN